MTNYWLSFQIEDVTVSGVTANKRREHLYGIIDANCVRWWLETTSFAIFESDQGIGTLAAEIKKVISTEHDTVLIRLLDEKRAKIIGKVDDLEGLRDLMPYAMRA